MWGYKSPAFSYPNQCLESLGYKITVFLNKLGVWMIVRYKSPAFSSLRTNECLEDVGLYKPRAFPVQMSVWRILGCKRLARSL